MIQLVESLEITVLMDNGTEAGGVAECVVAEADQRGVAGAGR